MLSIPEATPPHRTNRPIATPHTSATPAVVASTGALRTRALSPSECAGCGHFALALYPGNLCRNCDLTADALALVTP